MADLTYVNDVVVKENFNLALAFSEGYVFLRVVRREWNIVLFDPSQDIGTTSNLIAIPSATYRDFQFFSSSSSALNVPNEFSVTDDAHVYQVFVGVTPSPTKVFIAAEGVSQRQLDVSRWGTNSVYRFGYFDGFASPFYAPRPIGEIFITPKVGITFAVFNPMPYTISPIFYFAINRLQITTIKDPDTIGKILEGKIPARFASVGGLLAPKYNQSAAWVVEPIPIDARPEEIRNSVLPKGIISR